MQPYGTFGKGIMIIGEAPGEIEDARGKPFQGKTGILLRNTLSNLNINLFEDCIVLNAVNCRPTDKQGYNRTPTNAEIECCRSVKVLKAIKQYEPNIIILLGKSALYSIIGHRWKKNMDGISKWRGWAIPDQDFNSWIIPTFHPSYVERSQDMPVVKLIWKQDLELAISKIDIPVKKKKKAKIKIIEDLSILDNINEGQVIAFDFETTGIKPHGIGHRIICASVAVSSELCYVFMIPNERSKIAPFIRVLENNNIEKVAQNMKFEHTWSKVRLRTEVKGWNFDTMLASHIMDNRQSITGLKFQVYVNFGIIDYSSEIEPYLKSVGDEKNANEFNRIIDLIKTESGKEKLLTYCAWDSIYEYRLAEKLKDIIYHDLPF
jgi:uracil-DNA glycosylase family 4